MISLNDLLTAFFVRLYGSPKLALYIVTAAPRPPASAVIRYLVISSN